VIALATKLCILLIGWEREAPRDPSITFIHVTEDEIGRVNPERFDAVVIGDTAMVKLDPGKLQESAGRWSVPVFLSPDECDCRDLTSWFAHGFKDVVLPEELCDFLKESRALRGASSRGIEKTNDA